MPKATVLADSLGVANDEGVANRYPQGSTVDLSQEDFERHLAHGVVEAAEAPKKSSGRSKAAEAPSEEPEAAASE